MAKLAKSYVAHVRTPKKTLIASGCSWTHENYWSDSNPDMDCSWPKWPELLAKKLDMEPVNLGQSGAGNEYIYSSLLEAILTTKDKSQIGLVMPAWTQCQRKDYQVGSILPGDYGAVWKQGRFDPDGDVFSWVRKSLRYMLSLQVVCERYNIPLKQMQMISLYEGWIAGLGKGDGELYANRNNPDFEPRFRYPGKDKDRDRGKCHKILLAFEPYLNVKDFIGWPSVVKIGGWHIEQRLLRNNMK